MIDFLKHSLIILLQMVIFTASLTLLLTCVRIALDLSGVLV